MALLATPTLALQEQRYLCVGGPLDGELICLTEFSQNSGRIEQDGERGFYRVVEGGGPFEVVWISE